MRLWPVPPTRLRKQAGSGRRYFAVTPDSMAGQPCPPTASALLSADNATITFAAQKDGSLRATYQGWEDARIFRPGEHVEVRIGGGQVKVYRGGAPPRTGAGPLSGMGDEMTPFSTVHIDATGDHRDGDGKPLPAGYVLMIVDRHGFILDLSKVPT
jgi:hypothetical protein